MVAVRHDRIAVVAAALDEVADFPGAGRRVGVRRSTGRIIDDPWQVGGWPSLPSARAPRDSDRDGMPDRWERSRPFGDEVSHAPSEERSRLSTRCLAARLSEATRSRSFLVSSRCVSRPRSMRSPAICRNSIC